MEAGATGLTAGRAGTGGVGGLVMHCGFCQKAISNEIHIGCAECPGLELCLEVLCPSRHNATFRIVPSIWWSLRQYAGRRACAVRVAKDFLALTLTYHDGLHLFSAAHACSASLQVWSRTTTSALMTIEWLTT